MERTIRVLIVEDSPDDAELVVLALRRGALDPIGERVQTADGLRSALKNWKWDVVLSDYTLPGFGAAAALAIVRDFDPDLPFLVVSGTVGEDIAVGMMQAGANDYFIKDSLTRLVPAIERELRETENRRAKRLAEKETLLLAALVESSEDPIVSADLEGSIQTWNRAAEKLFGYAAAEVIGRSGFLLPPDRVAEVREMDLRIRRGEVVPTFETVRLRKGGEPVAVSISASGIRVGGQVVAKSVIYRDITPQKEAEARLREARSAADHHLARLRAVVATMTEGLIVSDADGNMLNWNDAALRVHGHTDAEEILKPLSWFASRFELNTPDGPLVPFSDWPLARVMRGEKLTGLELHLHRLDTGRRSVVSYSGAPVRGPGGEVELAVLTVHDVTESKNSERKLQLFRTLIDQTSDGIEVIDPKTGRFLDVNHQTCVSHGYTREELLSLSVSDLDPLVAARTWQSLVESDFVSQPQLFETLHKRKDGSTFPVEVSHDMIHLGREYVVAVVRDITERKRAENTLRASEARFRALVENSFDGVSMIDANGKILYATSASTRTMGHPLDNYIGRAGTEFVHPDDLPKLVEAFTRLAGEPGGKMSYSYRQRHQDGTWRFVEAVATNLLHDPDLQAFVLNSRDVTDRKLAEDAVRESEERFRAFMENSPASADIKDEDGRFVYVNAAWRRQFKNEAVDWRGKTNYDFWPRETADIFHESDQRCLERNAPIEMEETAYTPSGDLRTLLVLKFPILDGGARRIGGMAWDITARRNAEREARLAQQRLQHVLASSPAILYSLIVEGKNIRGISWISDNLKEILGYLPENAIGPDWWLQHIHPEDREAAAAGTITRLFGQGFSINEYRFRHQNGTYLWTRSETRLIRDDAGRPVEAVGSWSDVTALRSLEEQFRQAQKMEAVGQLAGGVAHDFNNLLTIINGYSDLLLRKLAKTDPSRHMISEIHKAGERSAALTRQLLAFSRQQVLAPRILNLNEVVGDTDKMLRRMIGEDVQFTTTLDSQLWAVRADPGQVEQVLMNLAVNARDAMPSGGRLTIETRNVELDELYARNHTDVRAGEHVLLSVTDTGTGMSQEVKRKIFEPFFTTKETGKGTGLGLATVYGIVKQSGGHVAVYSEIGVGTTFKVYFPRTEVSANHSKNPSDEQSPPHGTETILLVEDEEAVRTLVSQVLTACGYTVLEAMDGENAVRVAAGYDGTIHAMVTDVVMPGLGGRVAAERVAERHPGVRVLFVSGYTDDAVIRHGVLREGVNFLQKPFTPLALAIKVRDLLDYTK